MRFADPRSDIAFRKIFGNENKKEILISFLNAVLDLEGEYLISDVEILDSYQSPKVFQLKETTLDVRAKDKRGVTFIVEMQVEKQEFFGKRALYYSSKAYVNQLDKAKGYPKLNQVIFIGILDFSLFENKHYLSRHIILNQETQTQDIKDLEFYFIELSKFNKTLKELTTIIEKWVYFIKNAESLEVIPAELKATVEIEEAFEIADQHLWTKKELEVYEYWALEEDGRIDALNTAKKDGLREGREEGREEGKEEGDRLRGKIGTDKLFTGQRCPNNKYNSKINIVLYSNTIDLKGFLQKNHF